MQEVDQYIAKIDNKEHQAIMEHLRALLLEHPGLSEVYKWSVPVYSYGGKLIMYLANFKKHVTMGFYNGGLMPTEPGELLGDTNVLMRSVKFTKLSDIDDDSVRRLIRMSIGATGKLEVDW